MWLIFAVSICAMFYCAVDIDNALGANSGTDIALVWAYVVFGIGVVAVIAAEVLGMLSDTSGLLRTAIAIVGVAILIAICWGLADGTPLNLIGYEGSDNTYTWLKIADTGIFMAYIALAVAGISILATEIYNMIK